jgi:hypothetical protein
MHRSLQQRPRGHMREVPMGVSAAASGFSRCRELFRCWAEPIECRKLCAKMVPISVFQRRNLAGEHACHAVPWVVGGRGDHGLFLGRGDTLRWPCILSRIPPMGLQQHASSRRRLPAVSTLHKPFEGVTPVTSGPDAAHPIKGTRDQAEKPAPASAAAAGAGSLGLQASAAEVPAAAAAANSSSASPDRPQKLRSFRLSYEDVVQEEMLQEDLDDTVRTASMIEAPEGSECVAASGVRVWGFRAEPVLVQQVNSLGCLGRGRRILLFIWT